MFTAFTISESSKNLYRVAVEKREEAKDAAAAFVAASTKYAPVYTQIMARVNHLTAEIDFLKTLNGTILRRTALSITIMVLQKKALAINGHLKALDAERVTKIEEAQLALKEVKATPEAEGINVADCPASPSCALRVPLSTVARRATTGAPAPVSP
jgi:hypothetical protein